MTKAHKALWARDEDKKKMDIKIVQLDYESTTDFFADLVKVKNEDLKKLLK